MEPAAAINYLIPPSPYLWHWAADGAAVEWEDGSTVCLWMELHALLHHLAPQGLPPPGSILLVLMACGKRHPSALAAAAQFAAQATGGVEASSGAKGLLKRVAHVLESLAALPEDLRTGLSARAHLLTVLFDGIDNRQTPEASEKLLFEVDTWGIDQLNRNVPRLTGLARLLRDLKGLVAVHNRHDLTRLESLLRTGLECVKLQPVRIRVPQTPGESTLPLLQQLQEHSDRELAGIAAVARRMVAMFALPRPVGFPQELPVGGISDISNRGPLDRLLPSELAADDTLLMARLANHEALYFRRDTPPDEPVGERILLLDSGIHLWGMPRLYVLAAALGLQSTAGGEPVAVHFRHGPGFLPLPLAKVPDVQSCLQQLHPDPDAAPALAGFSLDADSRRRPDVFFLTISGARAQVREALHELASKVSTSGGRFYVITISRSGAVELSLRSPSGTRVLTRGRIDPDEILREPGSPTQAPPPKDRLTDLPAIIREVNFYQPYPLPFRFPAVPLVVQWDFSFAHWRVNVDTRLRLMMWNDDPRQGAGEITTGLPRAKRYHIGNHEREWVVICSGQPTGQQVMAVCCGMTEPTRRRVRLDSSHPFPIWMRCQNGAAILGYTDKAEACSLLHGKRMHSLPLPKDTPPGRVVFDGQQLGLATEPPPTAPVPHRDIPAYPSILGAPVSAGFVASGTLVVRAQGGRWELSMPEFIFSPSQKSQLNAVRPFRRVSEVRETGELEAPPAEVDAVPTFYEAVWNEDCRMIFDTRGLLHLLFSDRRGRAELTLLCLLGKPVAAWVAGRPQPLAGNPEWALQPPADLVPAIQLVPLLQRFASLARESEPRLMP